MNSMIRDKTAYLDTWEKSRLCFDKNGGNIQFKTYNHLHPSRRPLDHIEIRIETRQNETK